VLQLIEATLSAQNAMKGNLSCRCLVPLLYHLIKTAKDRIHKIIAGVN